MATTDVLAGTPFSINTLPIKASPTPKPAPAPTTAPDLEAQELEAYKQKGQLAELKDEAVLRKEKETAEAQAKTTADYAKAVTEDPTRKLLGEKVKERADTTFVPTKETAADMGLLFTLTNIVGFMIGGKSKGNAQQAMSAMNGMLEGHQKGREDLYKKEKAIFEENTKALDKTIEALDRQFKEAMQIYAVDKEAGMAKAQSAIAEHNATFLGDALKKNGLAYSADLLSKAVAQKDKKELAMQKLKDREEDIKRQERQHRENIALREREIALREEQKKIAGNKFIGFTEDGKHAVFSTADGKITIAQAPENVDFSKVMKVGQEADLESKERQKMLDRVAKENMQKEQLAAKEKLQKAKEAVGGKLKPGAKIAEGYVADLQLKQDLTDLKEDLKDPKLIKQIKDYRAEAFLSEEGKVINQLLSSDIPPELSKFLNKVSQLRNNYYLNISGKAVTGGEALRNYGVVSQPGDTPEKMAIKMESMLENVEQNIDTKRQLFTLPEIKRKPGQKTNLSPGQDYNSEDTMSSSSKTSSGTSVSNW